MERLENKLSELDIGMQYGSSHANPDDIDVDSMTNPIDEHIGYLREAIDELHDILEDAERVDKGEDEDDDEFDEEE